MNVLRIVEKIIRLEKVHDCGIISDYNIQLHFFLS
jgi:hypothetical protein